MLIALSGCDSERDYKTIKQTEYIGNNLLFTEEMALVYGECTLMHKAFNHYGDVNNKLTTISSLKDTLENNNEQKYELVPPDLYFVIKDAYVVTHKSALSSIGPQMVLLLEDAKGKLVCGSRSLLSIGTQ